VTHESRRTEKPRHYPGIHYHREPSGQVIQVWEDGETIWAEVKGISGRELVASGAEVAEATIRVWVRFRRDITAANRLKVLTGPFAGATLNIIGPYS
jgi:SPP1 family predicted phage head-tail adaptor